MNSPKGEETIFAEALRLPLEERAVYLTEATSGNAELLQRVESLLGSYGAGDFLEQAAVPELRPSLDPTVLIPLTEKPGQTIGRYKLLEQIGEGGCGVVYVAEQTGAIRRRVAVKIIKLGMDTKSVIARFEAERQALALMDHPNIAKVFDAGATETGRPYFVMELVRGIKITEYCDEKKLSPQQRLELFIEVCQAIQHAHQKGIIHRDIKPSNILVTVNDGVPVPKVIDFGVAKATSGQQLTDKTIYTAFEQFIGTPAYMSPEQAVLTSLDNDTRSDIYALGVLLYELLTGKTPFDAKELLAIGLDEMRRAIREQEPQRPSTRLSTLAQNELGTTAQRRGLDPPRLVSELRGDLDWIVMKALEKDRARRYETANGLVMDVQRHLNNEPVVACPPSRAYRFHKLVRRNKLAFSAASAVATALIIGLSTSTWMFFREREAKHEQERLRRRAETESAKSREVAQFLKDALEGVGPSVALGRDQTMLREILEQTAERIGRDLVGQPEVQVELLNTIGFAYWELGQWDAAETMYRSSLELMKKLWGNEHPDVSQTLHNLAELLRRQARPKEAAASEREALAINKKLFGEEHPAVAASLGNLAFVLEVEGKLEEAETLFRQALALNRKLLEKENPQLGVCLSRFGTVLNAQGKLTEAEAVYREAVAIQTKQVGKKSVGLAPEVELAWTLNYLSGVLEKQGKVSEADTTLGQAVAAISKVVSADHPDRVTLVGNWIRLNGRHGRLTKAEAICRDVLEERRKLHGDEHLAVAQALDNLANTLGRQGKHVEAESIFRDALALRK
jgi:serine/threonine protein kinase/Tfp pilus assembly protein PilF